MSEKVYIRCYVSTDKLGSECEEVYEYSKVDWDKLTSEERSELIEEFVQDHLMKNASDGGSVEDKDGNEIPYPY